MSINFNLTSCTGIFRLQHTDHILIQGKTQMIQKYTYKSGKRLEGIEWFNKMQTFMTSTQQMIFLLCL